MKKTIQIKSIYLVLLSVFLFSGSIQESNAQNVKKSTVRLKLNYSKVMGNQAIIDISAAARVNKKNIDVTGIDLNIYNIVDDEDILLGKITTDMNGKGKFMISHENPLMADSLNFYNVKIQFKGNEDFKKSTKSLSFKDADIKASLISKDSINYISATLIDKSTNEPLENEALGVQVERLFMPYQIEEFTVTDENGTILVPIPADIPGIDGNLNIEVVLNDHDDYGSVKSVVVAPIGTIIVDESTFDDRTMWSPRNKTPFFLLIFLNLIIFGMWGLIFYLVRNLYRIAKS